MAVSYKKLFHLLIEKNMTNAQLQQEAGFSANIITRLKRDGLVMLQWRNSEKMKMLQQMCW